MMRVISKLKALPEPKHRVSTVVVAIPGVLELDDAAVLLRARSRGGRCFASDSLLLVHAITPAIHSRDHPAISPAIHPRDHPRDRSVISP